MKTKLLHIVKKLFTLITLIIPITFTLTSCENMVTNVDVPDIEAKLVVNCYLSSDDTTINVKVSTSFPIGKPMLLDFSVKNAVVTIFSEQGSIVVPYDPNNSIYTLPLGEFPVDPGKSYDITVSAPGYKSVSARTTIPIEACSSIEYIGKTSSWDSDHEAWVDKYNLKIKDIPGQKNFYRAKMKLYEPDFIHPVLLDPDENFGLLSDKDNDGGYIYCSFLYYNYGKICTTADFYLLTTDENYYLFHKSYWSYTGDDPFTEPVLIHSNFTNGLGALGSFRYYEQEFTELK